MFPVKYRLKAHAVAAAGCSGRRFSAGPLSLSIVFRSDSAPSRFAVRVPKRAERRASRRNRLRRLVREAIRLRAAEIRPGFDAVITVVCDTGYDSPADFAPDLNRLFTAAGML